MASLTAKPLASLAASSPVESAGELARLSLAASLVDSAQTQLELKQAEPPADRPTKPKDSISSSSSSSVLTQSPSSSLTSLPSTAGSPGVPGAPSEPTEPAECAEPDKQQAAMPAAPAVDHTPALRLRSGSLAEGAELGLSSAAVCLSPRLSPAVQAPIPAASSNGAISSSIGATIGASSSRFFSSKLNTGSLWSLLGAGTSASTSNSELAMPAPNEPRPEEGARQHFEAKTVAFFNKAPFKRTQSQVTSSSLAQNQDQSQNQYQKQNVTSQQQDSTSLNRRARFTLRYIGNAMMYKSFTLPMLEWIARDIRRQSMRGSQSSSQRQFSIPARDIIFEIQANQLNGISCKDGHCVFVHPMHCVSKYAQLQHDPTCFSYLMRDSKDSPTFCHVFQAKSAKKVHEIFSAIREATSMASMQAGLQKSASLDLNYWRHHSAEKSALPDSGQLANELTSQASGQSKQSSTGALMNQTHYIATKQNQSADEKQQAESQQQMKQMKPQAASVVGQRQPVAHFENSYQFEVMFVKKVKLQCRRVPASFVDDALETLKSFEVLKGGLEAGSQRKPAASKRIISASVDERQEYDEACQSPEPAGGQARRSSGCASVSSSGALVAGGGRESRSCQQSPCKLGSCQFQGNSPTLASNVNDSSTTPTTNDTDSAIKKHQQLSLESLRSIGGLKELKDAPTYANDFSPYNTITSSDLNERIAAIPVVSASASLDHETRQRLARQVRETIMATAANIKRGVYASGDKLDSSSSSKALDSLSCTAASSLPEQDSDDEQAAWLHSCSQATPQTPASTSSIAVSSSSSSSSLVPTQSGQQSAQVNNFDLFRRASARQVVKNRTMLLLIGNDELCTISIDKHQMLFSKQFSSIVHCLQGHKNTDHFGLICRDSSKINPSQESYAGFIFKCQSDKVVREIMAALKQVIYGSHHNYRGLNSPYHPLNAANKLQVVEPAAVVTPAGSSLATKRSFTSLLQLDGAAHALGSRAEPATAPPSNQLLSGSFGPFVTGGNAGACKSLAKQATGATASVPLQAQTTPQSNPIKSMFCDNCPLYWYHRLCCDIESLPAEASKAIILRRIDSSLSEKEQDEIFTRFTEFSIDSIDEHNEIFMSILRQQCERKQSKHNQSQAHLAAMAKTSSLRSAAASSSASSTAANLAGASRITARSSGHQRSSSSGNQQSLIPAGAGSGSGGGGGGGQAQASALVDASSAAIGNLMRAKNSISVSIENMLKRRASNKDDPEEASSSLPARSGSFKAASRETRAHEGTAAASDDMAAGNLRRSQSTSDYPQTSRTSSTWRDSLTRTINDDLASPFVGLFRRRSSTFGSRATDTAYEVAPFEHADVSGQQSGQANSPSGSETGRFAFHAPIGGGQSPSSVLSGAFWKKSIFDKIRHPLEVAKAATVVPGARDTTSDHSSAPAVPPTLPQSAPEATQPDKCTRQEQQVPKKRTREELRLLWKKAIIEQTTLIKMDKQNQTLLAHSNGECNIQMVKLNYKDVLYNREALSLWDKLLKQNPTDKVEFVEVARLIRLGVPKQRRGEIWMFLMNQYQLRHSNSFQPADGEFNGDANQTYRSLLSQLSRQQHEIFVDIGRTFPSHPYYSQYLSIGQLSLFNLLKAYSLLDQEVGYCQGLSFVAGILLLHVDSEDEAFELMRHLLFNFGLRKQYLPSMNALHLQLYQMTRLLRDHEYELFNHFDRYDISPSLYAAPWFLTLFASQFPLGFVARLLDLIFLIGIEAVFRVTLTLLAYHRNSILNCSSLELTMDFLRNNLVKIGEKNLVKIFDKSVSLDLRNKLIEYEIEYTFYCAEDRARSGNNNSTNPSNPPNFKVSNCNRFTGKDSDLPKAIKHDEDVDKKVDTNSESTTSHVADATATIIIQHLLANNHLKSLRLNYTY